MNRNYNTTFIIDDDPVFVLLFKRIMLKIGRFETVFNYENGQLALDALIEKSNKNEPFPDIIFLDINMPIMNGWEFLSKLENQKFKNELTIYMISSSIDPTEIKKSKESLYMVILER